MPTVSLPTATLAYARHGRGDPILMIQGVGAAGRAYGPQIEALKADHEVVVFDNRGLGESTGDTRDMRIETMVGDAVGLLEHLGLQRVHVVGHSMGGVIAHQLALDHPTRVRTLALLNTFARGRDAHAIHARIAWLGLRTRVGTKAMRSRAFVDLVMSDEAIAAEGHAALEAKLSAIFGRSLAEPPAVESAQLAALGHHDAYGRLRELAAIPTLVMTGSQDPIARPVTAKALADAIPGARYVEVPNASHALPIEHPGLVDAELRALFGRGA